LVEVWKDIPHYEGRYQVSNLGRVRSCDRYSNNHFWKQQILKLRLAKTDNSGYKVCLWNNNKCKYYLVARLVASAFYGESNLTVNHIDGNRLNNKVENLEWCSRAENIRKGFEDGLYTTQKKTILINKETKVIKEFRSMSLASKEMNKDVGYISNNLKKGRKENKTYIWEVNNG